MFLDSFCENFRRNKQFREIFLTSAKAVVANYATGQLNNDTVYLTPVNSGDYHKDMKFYFKYLLWPLFYR